MKRKATIELSFEVDGRDPTSTEQDDITAQIMHEWTTWVFTYGDDSDDNGAMVLEQITAQWEAAQ